MKNKGLIFSTPNHPLHSQLKELKGSYSFYEMDPYANSLETWNLPKEIHGTENCPIMDFTVFSQAAKKEFLNLLGKNSASPVFTESSCYWGDSLQLHFSFLQGLFSTAFYSPNNKFEYFLSSQCDIKLKKFFENFFSDMGLSGIPVSSPGIGFIFPRAISLIINEAYFALGEDLCEPASMDQAMKFGVNYPLGPFEWLAKIGAEKVVLLLDQLKESTGDLRYRVHPLLRLEAQKCWTKKLQFA